MAQKEETRQETRQDNNDCLNKVIGNEMVAKPSWLHRPTGKWFFNRKDAKDFLGGLSAFNKAYKAGEIVFVPIAQTIEIDPADPNSQKIYF